MVNLSQVSILPDGPLQRDSRSNPRINNVFEKHSTLVKFPTNVFSYFYLDVLYFQMRLKFTSHNYVTVESTYMHRRIKEDSHVRGNKIFYFQIIPLIILYIHCWTYVHVIYDSNVESWNVRDSNVCILFELCNHSSTYESLTLDTLERTIRDKTREIVVFVGTIFHFLIVTRKKVLVDIETSAVSRSRKINFTETHRVYKNIESDWLVPDLTRFVTRDTCIRTLLCAYLNVHVYPRHTIVNSYR